VRSVEKALRSSHLTRGPLTEQFEEELATLVGKRFCLAFCNGTAAIYAAAKTYPDEAFNTSDVTFISVRNALRKAGKSVGVEPTEPDHFCSHEQGLPAVINDMGGFVPGGFKSIEDASHSLGNPEVGKDAQVVVGSLHAIKNLGIGEGGFAATDDEHRHLIMKDIRNMGRDMGNEEFNFHPNELSCSLGLSRMKRLDDDQAYKMLLVVGEYRKKLEGVVTFQYWGDQSVNPHLFLVRSPRASKIEHEFRKSNIQFIKHYKPLSIQGTKESPSARGNKESFKYWQECLTLPMWVGMRDQEIDRVVEAVKRA
jgi:perosamine synthetase